MKVAVSFSMFQALEGFPHVDVWQSRSDRSVDQIRTGRSGKVDEASWVNPKLVNHVKPLENIWWGGEMVFSVILSFLNAWLKLSYMMYHDVSWCIMMYRYAKWYFWLLWKDRYSPSSIRLVHTNPALTFPKNRFLVIRVIYIFKNIYIYTILSYTIYIILYIWYMLIYYISHMFILII